MSTTSQLVLAIEASNPSASEDGSSCSVAFGRDGVLGVEAIAPTGRHDDDLMPAIARLGERLGVEAKDIDRVAVSVGPGGYTGLRIAVTTARVIGATADAQCVAIPSADVVARNVDTDAPFAVALASKGKTAYVTLFQNPTTPTGEGRLMEASDLDELDIGLVVADRFLPPDMRARATDRGLDIRTPRFDAGACFEASIGREGCDPSMLMPLYPREPEAVRQWRARADSRR